MHKANCLALLTALFALAPYGQAQTPGATIPTNLPGVTTSIAPPANFNPLTASDDQLALYGFPPRPNPQTSPDAYASWQTAMLASKQRIFPQLQMTDLFHGPARSIETVNGTATSSNWSGTAVFGTATSYNQTTAFRIVTANYVVPIASQAYGVCSGTAYAASWVGIDGDESNDVLQAGTESQAQCVGSKIDATYYAWYEWFPFAEVKIVNFPIVPGNDLYVEVWNTSDTQGNVYFVNYNTNKSVTIGFSAPSGTKLVGNSAEWVVERPEVGGNLTTLANYISDYFSNCFANTWAGTEYKLNAAGALQITMLDNGGNRISVPTLLGSTAVWLQDKGPAR